MESVKGDDLDCLLVQMEHRLETDQKTKTAFTERDFELGFTVQIPEQFLQADQDAAAEIFWSGNRPSILLLSADGRAGITFFTLQEEDLVLLDVAGNREQTRAVLERSDDRTVFYGKGEVENGVLWLEYKSFAEDECVYNLSFFFQAAEKNVTGNFYCLFQDYDRWKPIVFQILETIMRKRKED